MRYLTAHSNVLRERFQRWQLWLYQRIQRDLSSGVIEHHHLNPHQEVLLQYHELSWKDIIGIGVNLLNED